jgi:hypothetical protein
MKKLSTVFFLMLMPMMSIAQTGTIKAQVIKSELKQPVRLDSTDIRSVPTHNNLDQLVALTPGVVNDNANCTGFTISSNCRFRANRGPDNCTPPHRGSVMVDTSARHPITPQFVVSEFSCPTCGVRQSPRQHKQITITPNPSNSIIRLTFTSENEIGIALHVYNSRGAIVRTIREDEVGIGDWSTTINMSDCTEGTYVVQLIQGSDVRIGRFMLLKQ